MPQQLFSKAYFAYRYKRSSLKMAIVQEIRPRDCVKRLNFGLKIEAVLEKNNDVMFFMS